MSPVHARPYLHPEDLPVLIEFLKTVRPTVWINEYPKVADLREAMGRPSIREKTGLWFTKQGKLEAFAYVLDPYNNLVFEFSPDMGLESEHEIVNWALTCAIHSVENDLDTLYTNCRDDDLGRIALLERQGFMLMKENTLLLARSLDAIISKPQLPDGFTIRSIAGENEVDQLVALHRAAFGTSNLTRVERLAIMRAPDYDPVLDLVVVTPDGRMAGYCTCSISTAENKLSGSMIGHTDPVAVHPEFRKRGLARALLLAGTQLLKERGMEMAMLNTSSENKAMQKTAEAAGFRVYSKRIWFSKVIPKNNDA
jgi:mycothiol synthase